MSIFWQVLEDLEGKNQEADYTEQLTYYFDLQHTLQYLLWPFLISLEINPYSRWRTFNCFRTSSVRILGECMVGKPATLPPLPSTDFPEFASRTGHKAGQSLMPPFISSFLLCRDMRKGGHTGPIPGKRETIHSWYIFYSFKAETLVLLGLQIQSATTDYSFNFPEKTRAD